VEMNFGVGIFWKGIFFNDVRVKFIFSLTWLNHIKRIYF